VTATNAAGISSLPASFAVTADADGPTGMAATVAGGFVTSLSVPVTLTSGSDALSGVDAASGIVERESATLAGAACGSYSGAWTEVSLVAGADTSVQSGHCYEYRYRISDNVGNESTSAPSATVKVDATAPATPSLSFGSFTNASATGSTIYFRPGSAGGFTVTGSSTDSGSGVASYAYPSLGSGWSAGGAYTFTAAASDPAEPLNVTATDVAGNTSAATAFTVTADGSAPVSSATCNGGPCSSGWYGASPVSVALAATDGGSGVARILYSTDGSAPSLTYTGAISLTASANVNRRGPVSS
jgi:hypothetical protein